MGGDGGSTTTSRKFIRGQEEKKVDEGKEDNLQRKYRSQTCALSSLPLSEPIVACQLGNLYSEEAVLEALLDKSLQKTHSHIRGMRDIRRLILHPNTARLSAVTASVAVANTGSDDIPRFMCPITQQAFNGLRSFVCIWTTGHVLSEAAIQEMGTEALQDEYGPFETDDIFKLLPNEHEIDGIVANMSARRKLEKDSKVKKKRKIGDRCNEEDAKEIVPSVKAVSKEDIHRRGELLSVSSTLSTSVLTTESLQLRSAVFKSIFNQTG